MLDTREELFRRVESAAVSASGEREGYCKGGHRLDSNDRDMSWILLRKLFSLERMLATKQSWPGIKRGTIDGHTIWM